MPSLLLVNWPFVVSRLVIDKVSPSISLKPLSKSEALMIYVVSSMPLFKVAILPVSSGASFTGAKEKDWVSVVSELIELIIE